jgi:hypothetical protein
MREKMPFFSTLFDGRAPWHLNYQDQIQLKMTGVILRNFG